MRRDIILNWLLLSFNDHFREKQSTADLMDDPSLVLIYLVVGAKTRTRSTSIFFAAFLKQYVHSLYHNRARKNAAMGYVKTKDLLC